MTTTHDLADLAGFATGTTREITTAADCFGLSMSRTYAASAPDLWSAWTEPDRLARWLGRPFGELREGGSLRLVKAGPDSVEPPHGVTDSCADIIVLHCRAPERLTVRWAWGDEPPSIVDLVLTPLDAERTVLHLDHVVLDQDNATAYGAGWEGFLARLDAVVAGTDSQFESIEPQLKPMWESALSIARPVPLPTITSTGLTSHLDLERWVAADPAAVWDCVTTTEGLRRWYVNEITGAMAPGGSFRCVFDQDAGVARSCAATPRTSSRWAGSGTGWRRPRG